MRNFSIVGKLEVGVERIFACSARGCSLSEFTCKGNSRARLTKIGLVVKKYHFRKFVTCEILGITIFVDNRVELFFRVEFGDLSMEPSGVEALVDATSNRIKRRSRSCSVSIA